MLKKGTEVLVHMPDGKIGKGIVVSAEKSKKYSVRYRVKISGKEYSVPEKFIEKIVAKYSL